MKFNLEDISMMIACLLTIYEESIYMPFETTFEGKRIVFVCKNEERNAIKSLDDLDKHEDGFLLYIGNMNEDTANKNIAFANHQPINDKNVYICDANFKDYKYIGDFIDYLIYYQVNDVTDIDVMKNFLNMNYSKPKKRIKLH